MIEIFFFISSVSQKLTLAHQQLTNEHEKLKQDEAEKSARLQELMYVQSPRNTKLANDIINTKLATPKKSHKTNLNSKKSPEWSDDDSSIDHICDYYDELQYNYDYFNGHCDNETTQSDSHAQLTKLRKNILNRRLIDHRQRLKCEKMMRANDKSVLSSLSSIVESITIPTLHFHLILSLTMVILTHQCPQYLLVL